MSKVAGTLARRDPSPAAGNQGLQNLVALDFEGIGPPQRNDTGTRPQQSLVLTFLPLRIYLGR